MEAHMRNGFVTAWSIFRDCSVCWSTDYRSLTTRLSYVYATRAYAEEKIVHQPFPCLACGFWMLLAA